MGICISLVIASGTHSADQAFVSVDGTTVNLNSLTLGELDGSHTYAAGITQNPGHNANQIWVSVKDGEMTLLSALQSTDKLCPSPSDPLTYTSASIPNPSHLATEITLTSGKTLQQAINDGIYCCTPSCSGKNCGGDGCGGTCGTCTSPQTCSSSGVCTSPCVSNVGQSCGGNSCTNAGTVACDGTCTGASYLARGTSCASNKACDGSGTCQGWSGSDCFSCPFGHTGLTAGDTAYCNNDGTYLSASYPSYTWSNTRAICALPALCCWSQIISCLWEDPACGGNPWEMEPGSG